MSPSDTTQSPSTRTAFISYSHEDRGAAQKLATALREAGIVVIIDDEMRAGQSIERFIEGSVRSADVTISLVSEKSLLSGWVARETITALEARRVIPDMEFIGCYLDKGFFEPNFRLKATNSIDEKIAEIDALVPKYGEEKLSLEDLVSERSRLISLRNELGGILTELRDSLSLNLQEESFDRNVARLVETIQGSTDPSPSTTSLPDTSDTPSEEHGSRLLNWLSGHLVGVFLVAFFAVIFLWVAYQAPRLTQVRNTVEKSSQEFLRLMGEQDAGAISVMVEVPFFFGDDKFTNPDKTHVEKLFSKLFEHARAGTEQKSDSVQIRLGAALSRYFSTEMKRTDFNVFEVVSIEDIEPDLTSEKAEDRGTIPEPRVSIGDDGARASVRLSGYRPVDVMHLFFSVRGDNAGLRGVLLQAPPATTVPPPPSQLKPAQLINASGTIGRIQSTEQCHSVAWVQILDDGTIRIGLAATTSESTPKVAVVHVEKRLGTGNTYEPWTDFALNVGATQLFRLPDGRNIHMQVNDVAECTSGYTISMQ